MRPVIQYTTGLPGCGKTYVRCAKFVPEFLLNNDGDIITNYPWNKDAIAEYCAKVDKYRAGLSWLQFRPRKARTFDDFKRRMIDIPVEVLQQCRNFNLGVGPWTWLEENCNLRGAHVAIDEIHNFCPTNLFVLNPALRAGWSYFLGEVRHDGLTIEFISQSPEKVNSVIEQHTHTWISLVSCEGDRDPFFQIQNYYWYNLAAKFFFTYAPGVFQIERQFEDKKKIEKMRRKFRLDPDYFKFYNSYSKPYHRTEDSETDYLLHGLSEPEKVEPVSNAPVHPYQKYNFLGLLWWFCRDNAYQLLTRILFLIALGWLCCGGICYLIDKGTKKLSESFSSGVNTSAVKVDAKKPSAPKKPVISTPVSTVQVDSDIALARQIYPNASDAELRKMCTPRTSVSVSKPALSENPTLPKLTLISLDNIAFEDGITLRVGESLPYQGFLDLHVVSIDYKRRIVKLSNKTILRLGQ